MTSKPKPRVAILGAGPMGIEAALRACALGLKTRVFERGEIADNVSRWGHVRLFTPWSYNCSTLGRRRLAETGRAPVDSKTICPTGREFVTEYLQPLAELAEMEGAIETGCKVVACGRREIAKNDLIGKPERARYPFVLLTQSREGVETLREADIVIDCTGVYGNHNRLGEGGIAAIGESELEAEICYDIPDPLGRDRAQYAGRNTLLVGGGHSAATTAAALAELARQEPRTRVTWITRAAGTTVIEEVEADRLAERRELTRKANALAAEPPAGFAHLGGAQAIRIRRAGGGFDVTVRTSSGASRSIQCERIVANVGYHPDERIYRQLQVHECYATLGPMGLAASLLGQEGVDCLEVQSGGAETLRTTEPNFYILGAKSFGLNAKFLMRLGHKQIDEVMRAIAKDFGLKKR